ncbi:MAG: class I SAM-dependent RNA methyltransferase [Kiritimatiellae bacterium]|nr:class I SAM-dependent RNA methyltransferase [Kiritimatiellia bacterium]
MKEHRAHNTEEPAEGSSGGQVRGHASTIAVTCARGLAPVLVEELEELGRAAVVVEDTCVETRGTLADCEELNVRLRTAHRVLWLWQVFEAASEADLYRGAVALSWEEVLRADQPVSVRAAVAGGGPGERAVVLRTKDALADRMRARLGRRPDSGPQPLGACVFVHWAPPVCRVFVDTTGVPLSFRGYRRRAVAAPLRETLAAGVLLGAGWRGQAPLVNPMCGGGTIAIEAAWIAARRAPGLLRRRFAFMSLRGFDAEVWASRRRRAAAEERPVEVPIVAADRDPAAIEAARENLRAAGLEGVVRLVVAALEETPAVGAGAWYALNPAYGVRLGDAEEVAADHVAIGRFLRQRADGGRAVVITGNLRMARRIGLRLARRWTVFNGPIECRVLEFDLRGPVGRGGARGGLAPSPPV